MMTVVMTLNIIVLIYFLLLSTGYITLLAASISNILARFKEVDSGNMLSFMSAFTLPPVSVIMPVYNEEQYCIDAIESIMNSTYQNLKLIVVNDGSTDDTFARLMNKYQLVKLETKIDDQIKTTNSIRGYYVSPINDRITVIDKYHTERSDTMNIGVNACRTPHLITIDADTIAEPDAISKLMFYMLSQKNLDAAGGGVYILNNCVIEKGQLVEANLPTSPICAIQACEYLRSFVFTKAGWNSFGGSLSYSGTFTVFKTASLITMGGFDLNNLSQDFEIVTHIKAYQYDNKLSSQVGYTPAAGVWTDVPSTFSDYWKQRYNWQYYTLKSLMMHSYMLFNPRYGVTGLFTYPFFLFGEALGAVVEFTAYILIIASALLGIFNLSTTLLMIALAWGFFTLLTMTTVFINITTFNRYSRSKDILKIFFYTLVEVIGFRQFNVTCRTFATFAYFLGGRSSRENDDLALERS